MNNNVTFQPNGTPENHYSGPGINFLRVSARIRSCKFKNKKKEEFPLTHQSSINFEIMHQLPRLIKICAQILFYYSFT